MSPIVSVTGAAAENPTLPPPDPARTPLWVERILPAVGLNLIFYRDFPPPHPSSLRAPPRVSLTVMVIRTACCLSNQATKRVEK